MIQDFILIKYTSITFFKSIRHHLLYKLTATLLVLFSPTLFAKQPISTEFCNQMKVEFSEVYVPQLPIVIDNLTQIVSMHIINDRNKKCIINVVYEVELTKMISASAKEEKINYEDMRNIYNSEENKDSKYNNLDKEIFELGT